MGRRIARNWFTQAFSICLAATLTFATITVVTGNRDVSTGIHQSQHSLTLAERLHYQMAIEEVYRRHRIWPDVNQRTKPLLTDVMPQAAIQAKVDDYLRKSQALEVYWQQPITGVQLQAEIDRLASRTKQPQVLMELWAALENNPYVIAECLARPLLADRLIRNWYGADAQFHGELRARAEEELGRHNDVGQMRLVSGEYKEIEWVKKDVEMMNAAASEPNVLELSEEEYEQQVIGLAREFGAERGDEIQERVELSHQGASDIESLRTEDLPVGRLTGLQEDDERFSVKAVLERGRDRLKIALVEWRKEPFDEWWNHEREQLGALEPSLAHEYRLTEMAAASSSCADNTWTLTNTGPPSARLHHTAVWTGSEMIVWGGYDGVNHLSTGGRYNPATDTWTLTDTTNAPSPRRGGHTAVWTGSEMIVWGGGDNDFNTLNTGGRYNPAADIWMATSTAGAPSARSSHTAVWTGSVMIVWGGSNDVFGEASTSTGGRYNPSTNSWTATTLTSAPEGRSDHMAVWTGSEMIVWGGFDNDFNRLNTGGRYNPSANTWTATDTTSAPSGRRGHTAVWTGSHMIVWGGSDRNNFLLTGGRYNPVTNSWAATSTFNAPEARTDHQAVWTGSVMIVWGGRGEHVWNTGGRYNPATDNWAATTTTNVPVAVVSHTAVWTGNEMIVWGGSRGADPLPMDTGGRYNPATNSWRPTSRNSAPTGRTDHTSIWTGSEMIVWGGSTAVNTGTNTGGRYNPATDNWQPTDTANAPGPRFQHTAVWNGAEMIAWGGFNGTNYLDTGGHYNPSSNSWTPTNSGGPSPRARHTAVWGISVNRGVPGMIVWGGFDGLNFLNNGEDYAVHPRFGVYTWSPLHTTGAVPAARADHSAVWTGSVMIVWGGNAGGTVRFNTGGSYNPLDSLTGWAATSTTNAPTGRTRHTAIWTGSEMIVWGGSTGTTTVTNTGGRYNPSSNSWTATSLTSVPEGRFDHTAVWTGLEMIVWGGTTIRANFVNLNTGGRYKPVANSWQATGTTAAPSSGAGHTAVWTGSEMIVWGGFLSTGGRYCASACTFARSPASQSFAANGGKGNITVTSPTGCGWTATSNAGWVTITSGSSGTGNGIVAYSVVQNTTSDRRSGTITIAGQTFTIYQGAAFLDVPLSHPFYTEIGKLSARGITSGCGGGNYCPDATVTREQMAKFIILALHEPEYTPPPPPSQRFDDVPPSNIFYPFIEEMAVRQITSGCSTNPPLYCPTDVVLREQMAKFIVLALHPPGYIPPLPPSQRFDDVPPLNIFYAFIEEMAVRGITTGCSANPPLYCPSASVTRGQMAAFIVRAFNL